MGRRERPRGTDYRLVLMNEGAPSTSAAWRELDATLEALIEYHERRALALARSLHPGATSDDLRQPHDLPALAEHPEFQHAEGLLAGVWAAAVALRARARELGLAEPSAGERPNAEC